MDPPTGNCMRRKSPKFNQMREDECEGPIGSIYSCKVPSKLAIVGNLSISESREGHCEELPL